MHPQHYVPATSPPLLPASALQPSPAFRLPQAPLQALTCPVAPIQLAAYVVISFALMMMVALATSIVGGAVMLAVLDDGAPPTEVQAEDPEPSAALTHSE
jgi:hypothetical protein